MTASQGVLAVEAGEPVWGFGWIRVSCGACDRAWLVLRGHEGEACPCGEAKVEASSGEIPRVPPEHLVPAIVAREDLAKRLKEQVRRSWLLDRGLSIPDLVGRARLTWWPRWQLDATAVGHYTAEVGYDYEARSHVERYDGAAWTTEEKVDIRVDWQPRTGEIVRRLDDVPAPALAEDALWRERLGDVSRFEPVDFAPQQVPDAWIELPDLLPDEVWHRAEPAFRAWVGRMAQEAAGGQHVREVHFVGRYAESMWTVCLRPVWRTWYIGSDGKVRRIVIDGLTGQQHGALRASWTRALVWAGLFGSVAAVATLVMVITLVAAIFLPPLLALPILAALVAIFATILAFLPVLQVWSWNARALGAGE